MGVIKNEGIKQSIVTYIGVLIGVVNTMYFYPKYFSEEELGMFRFLIDSATLIFPFITLGIHNLSVRMFPTFKNEENGHNGMWFFLLTGVLVGVCFLFLVTYPLLPFFSGFFVDKSLLIQDNWYYIIPLAALIVVSRISIQYILNFKKVLIVTIVDDLLIKVGLPVIAVLCFFDYLSLEEGIYVLLGIFGAQVLILLGYIVYLKEWHFRPNWSFLTKPLLREMGIYSFYGVLGSLGSVLATRIDVFMIGMLADNDMKDVGVYSIALFMANVVTVPARAINNIASPVIAESWKNKDMSNISSVYSKSSIVLLTIGILVMVGLWCSIDDIFALMPNGEKFAVGKYVILILGIGKLFDLATGANGQIIAYSKYFRFNFYAVLVLAVINVIANFVFIPNFQINGAALATMSSLIIFNLSKLLYIKYKLNLNPFSIDTLKVLAIGGVTLLLGLYMPSTHFLFLDIVLRSALITVVFVSLVLYFKVSEDLSALFYQVLGKLKGILGF